jgi:hypothetical protein
MLNQSVKENINKIDFRLKEIFSEVRILERSFHNKYFFEITAEGKFQNLLESNTTRKVKSLIVIEKKDLEKDIVTWKYSINPNNPNADFIERVSNIDRIVEDIHNTITKKQMDMDYLNSTPEVKEISEEDSEETETEETTEEKILNIVDKFSIDVYDMQSIVNETNIFEFPTRNFLIYHGGLKMSDKFKIESEILKLENINYVFFDEDFIKVNHK